MEIYIGLDGGGTKTLAIGIDKNGKELGRYQSPCSNYHSVGVEKAKEAVFESINKVIEIVKEQNNNVIVDVKHICLGMSGVDRDEDKQLVGSWIRELLPQTHFEIYNDAVVALASGTSGHLYGVVLISGTGCISVGYDKLGNHTRSAGWGPLLGDKGSGYQIGFDICAAVCRAKDKTSPDTCLTQSLLEKLNLKTESDLITWAYDPENQGWHKFASLSPLATEGAIKGDQVSKDILESAAQSLSEYVSSIIMKLNLNKDPEVPLVLAGGIIERKCILSDYLSKILLQKYPNLSIRFPQCDSAMGAALLALNHHKESK